jgi:nucleoside-diphosphate-sugar epimerase
VVASQIPYLIVRLPNVVGSYGNPAQLVPNLVGQVLAGRVHVQRHATRDLVDAVDMARTVVELLERNTGRGIVNLASGHSVTVTSIVDEICTILEAVPVIVLSDSGERQCFDTSRIKEILGHDPFPDPTYYRAVLRRHVRQLAEGLSHAGP